MEQGRRSRHGIAMPTCLPAGRCSRTTCPRRRSSKDATGITQTALAEISHMDFCPRRRSAVARPSQSFSMILPRFRTSTNSFRTRQSPWRAIRPRLRQEALLSRTKTFDATTVSSTAVSCSPLCHFPLCRMPCVAVVPRSFSGAGWRSRAFYGQKVTV